MTPQTLARVVSTFSLSEDQLARLFEAWDEAKHTRPARDYSALARALDAQEDEAVAALREVLLEARDRFVTYVEQSLGKEMKDRATWLDRLDLKGWGPVQDAFGETLRQAWEQGRRYVRSVAPSTRMMTEWDESKHPRHSAGSERGGEFAPAFNVDEFISDVDEGLNVEHPDVAQELEKYILENRLSALKRAMQLDDYAAYRSDLHLLLKRHFPSGVIIAKRIEGYTRERGVPESTGEFGSVSITPTWGQGSAARGKTVKTVRVPISAVVAAGSTSEGELVVRRERLFVAEYAAPTSFAPRASLEWLKQKQLYVSGVARDDLLKRAKALLLQALKTGEPEEETMRKLYESWVPYVGTDVDPNALARLRTIIRTNSTEALNEGIVAEARSPEMAKVIKALVYVATLDDRTTPLCEFLHGTQIWPDDPRLDAIVPPNHFNCRSILDPVIDDDEYDPDALLSIDKYREAVAMIEPGFGGGKAVNLKEAQ